MSSENGSVLQIKVIVELDPGAVIRVLQHFQERNVVPRRVSAQSLGTEYIQVEFEVAGLAVEAVHQIVSKIRSAPTAIAAVLCDSEIEADSSASGGGHATSQRFPAHCGSPRRTHRARERTQNNKLRPKSRGQIGRIPFDPVLTVNAAESRRSQI